MTETTPNSAPASAPDTATGTLIVGGGIIGLLTARELALAGAPDITLVEMGETGQESSWAGGGIVSPLYPWQCAEPITALARWSQDAYPELCETLAADTGIDPELTGSGLLILDSEEQERAADWAQAQGVRLQVVPGERLAELEPELAVRPPRALLLPRVAQVRNPRLVKALRAYLNSRVAIREHQEASEILTGEGRVRGIRTPQGEIAAERVVICTGAWTARLVEGLRDGQAPHPEIRPVRGQMIRFLTRPGHIRHIVLYRDRYVIPRRDGRILVGSTLEQTGFVKATTAEAKEELYRAGIGLFPFLKHTPIEDHWAGLRPGSPSGIPYIGPFPGISGLYLNAGHFRNGVVTGPASARLGADLALGRPPILDPAPYAVDAPR